ncbi:hypothetical protein KHA80_08405 [Anaerobacillus sp. HL2]|nr:hypothetical protein KHA80_08405 [Anaerobacillus sp. HL2]
MYTSYENLLKSCRTCKRSLTVPAPKLLFLDEDAKIEGEKALEVAINYGSKANNVVYQYDEQKAKYIRIVGEEQSRS